MAKSSFVTDLNVSPVDGRRWKVKTPFTYHRWVYGSRDMYTVPMGFITDFASFPFWRFLFWWLPQWAKYNKAPVLHDYLYQHADKFFGMTREKADLIFHEAMRVAFRHHKSGRVIARLEYWGVRVGGRWSYKGGKK